MAQRGSCVLWPTSRTAQRGGKSNLLSQLKVPHQAVGAIDFMRFCVDSAQSLAQFRVPLLTARWSNIGNPAEVRIRANVHEARSMEEIWTVGYTFLGEFQLPALHSENTCRNPTWRFRTRPSTSSRSFGATKLLDYQLLRLPPNASQANSNKLRSRRLRHIEGLAAATQQSLFPQQLRQQTLDELTKTARNFPKCVCHDAV
jgi:hypothetical protein